MPVSQLPSDVLEAFLAPHLPAWNRLTLADLEAFRAQDLGEDPSVQVNCEGHLRTAYGYECVTFTLERGGQFKLVFQIEGKPEALSFVTHHPALRIEGDVAAAEAWLLETWAARTLNS